MGITKKAFGRTKDGRQVTSYTLSNGNGMEARFIDYGAALVSLIVPGRGGKKADVVLGYDDVAGYENTTTYFGGFIGRYANRISGGSFALEGITYELEKNENGNCLHSGSLGYNNMIYEAEMYEEEEGATISFSRISPDMEQGFPGNLKVTVTYMLTYGNELVMEYSASADKDTPINLTNHSYFNLSGHDSGTVLNHKVRIYADEYMPTDVELIPTGEVASVKGTPMDFREYKAIGQDIQKDYVPLILAGGYDHNYVLNHSEEEIDLVAEMADEASGRSLEVYTDLPGMQFYTGNFIEGTGKGGCIYKKRSGVCFETQYFPNAINDKRFQSPVLKEGEEFRSITVYRFNWA